MEPESACDTRIGLLLIPDSRLTKPPAESRVAPELTLLFALAHSIPSAAPEVFLHGILPAHLSRCLSPARTNNARIPRTSGLASREPRIVLGTFLHPGSIFLYRSCRAVRAYISRHLIMSSGQEAPVGDPVSKSQRVLACVLCQQRKVKCDRKFPCANCVKSRAQCVPATLLPRRPRRKVQERDLFDRLRRYEDLLRKNNIKFEPDDDDATLENDQPSGSAGDVHVNHAEGVDEPSPATTVKSSTSSSVKYVRTNTV